MSTDEYLAKQQQDVTTAAIAIMEVTIFCSTFAFELGDDFYQQLALEMYQLTGYLQVLAW